MKLRLIALMLTLALCLNVTAFAVSSNPADIERAYDDAESFAFVYFGDVHIGLDIPADAAAWEALAGTAVSNPGVAFALQGGDIVDSGINAEQWDAFIAATDDALGDVPIFTVNGNHESNFLSGKPEKYLQRLTLPQNGPDGFKGEFYSFDYGDAHVIALNSWVFSGEQRLSDDDFARIDEWVAADLRGSGAAWKIAVMHVPVYAVHSDATAAKVREHWAPLFERYGVTLVLTAHQHVYSRLKPLTGGAVDFDDGVTQIMGNASRKHYGAADETLAERTIYNVATYQLLRVDGTSLTVQTFDVDGNELDYVALSPRSSAETTRLAYFDALWIASGRQSADTSAPFADVSSPAVDWAYAHGLTLGVGGNAFAPDRAITDAEIELVQGRMESE